MERPYFLPLEGALWKKTPFKGGKKKSWKKNKPLDAIVGNNMPVFTFLVNITVENEMGMRLTCTRLTTTLEDALREITVPEQEKRIHNMYMYGDAAASRLAALKDMYPDMESYRGYKPLSNVKYAAMESIRLLFGAWNVERFERMNQTWVMRVDTQRQGNQIPAAFAVFSLYKHKGMSNREPTDYEPFILYMHVFTPSMLCVHLYTEDEVTQITHNLFTLITSDVFLREFSNRLPHIMYCPNTMVLHELLKGNPGATPAESWKKGGQEKDVIRGMDIRVELRREQKK